MNECFAQNMIGRIVAFQVQPYSSGKGIIKVCTPRRIRHQERHPTKGNTFVEYETFDLELEATEGSEVGAFYCGVAVSPARPLQGQPVLLLGVSYGKLQCATRAENPEPIVIARCG